MNLPPISWFIIGAIFSWFLSLQREQYRDNELHRKIHNLRRQLMATKDDVLQAIADEKAQVLTAIEDFNVQIQALKDQIAQGQAVTAADLDDVVNAVHDIFVPITS